ncbi:glycosyltransferase involved in cell wall biosynthesis [Microvirga lupini]|uniref:Glycosyltransferase involved in cell wall biosynthesis n=1 Tax=Microvirga lupini TaxID=420324 RepID=A0A7W4VH88_9HYPH|nr:glycosyltransferase family 4 protein [Microvirga lupini]MBB3017185.1 glycosyltransferase involved in cell wall biosynthesis [Microvirga lupini]
MLSNPSPETQDSKTLGRKLVFVVTEDWFFASHFLPMVKAARELGLAVTVVTRVRAHREVIEALGAKVVPLDIERGSLNPITMGDASGQLAAILKAEKADLVHCIALKGILLGGFAATLAGVGRRVYALTGLGFLGARSDTVGRLSQRAIRLLMRSLQTSRTHYVFENTDDPKLLGLDPMDPRVTILGGAGVDPDILKPEPLPFQPPLRVAVVARMLWSKGIDVAVEAVRMARAKGSPIELSLYGAPDPSNPKAIPEEALKAWSAEPGITWHGATRDIAGVWRDRHVACLPSRGGEGLPRTLLEAAACGRAIVTTDVPGCRTLVRDGVEGLLVPPGDPAALSEALLTLSGQPDRVARMGEAARTRVLDGFTERDVMNSVKELYRSLLAS